MKETERIRNNVQSENIAHLPNLVRLG